MLPLTFIPQATREPFPHKNEEERNAIDIMIDKVLEAERTMLKDNISTLKVVHKDEWGAIDAVTSKSLLSKSAAMYSPQQLLASNWEDAGHFVGGGVGLASGRWS
jgi:hypothetical protein